MNPPLIELEHCSLVLDGQRVLDDISFSIRRGERWALIGANGAGKTLLLKLLRGDMWPTPEGLERRTYALDGLPSSDPSDSKRRIAYIGPERQDKYVRYGWNLSVRAVVTTGLFDEDIPLSRPTAAQRARVVRTLKRFGLWALRERKMLTLSYGQRRLALAARAFVSDASVLLLDEVYNGLDSNVRAKLRRALETSRGGPAWVLTTHRKQDLPKNTTHLAYVDRGRLVHVDPVAAQGSAARHLRTSARDFGSAARTVGGSRVMPQRDGTRRGQARSTDGDRGREAWLVRMRGVTLYRDYRAVVRKLDWTLLRGEHWAVLGANGSGKSTVLTLLYGDLHPALGGAIERAGAPVGTHIEEWKRRVGWVSPEIQAEYYAGRSIEEIVISGRYASVGLNEAPSRRDRVAARRWLEFFDIASLRSRGPRQVSYGQLRLALIARAMINEPELLLLDEPLTGLGGDVRAYVFDALQRLAETGTQIVMAVHEPEDLIPAVTNVLRIGRGGSTTVERRKREATGWSLRRRSPLEGSG